MKLKKNLSEKDRVIARFKSRSDDSLVYVCITQFGVLYMYEKSNPDFTMVLHDFPKHVQNKIMNDMVYADEVPIIMEMFGKYLPLFMGMSEKIFTKKGWVKC